MFKLIKINLLGERGRERLKNGNLVYKQPKNLGMSVLN